MFMVKQDDLQFAALIQQKPPRLPDGTGVPAMPPRPRLPWKEEVSARKGWINMQGQVVVCCVHVAIWSDEPVCGMFAAPFEVRRVTCVFVDTFTALGMDVDIWHRMWGSPVRFKEPKRCVGLNLRPKGAQLGRFHPCSLLIILFWGNPVSTVDETRTFWKHGTCINLHML